MAREIKFRAWNKSIGLMIEHNEMSPQRSKMEFGARATLDSILTNDNYEVMQYTGLKDKNGTDIYEGDVVIHEGENPNWNPLDDDSPLRIKFTSSVDYRGQGFWLSNEYFGWEGEGLANWELIEVIGNIYENPELIK